MKCSHYLSLLKYLLVYHNEKATCTGPLAQPKVTRGAKPAEHPLNSNNHGLLPLLLAPLLPYNSEVCSEAELPPLSARIR